MGSKPGEAAKTAIRRILPAVAVGHRFVAKANPGLMGVDVLQQAEALSAAFMDRR
jgi:hypothetical protein